ncbi:PoNe immunity protein domain-containing protein [Paraburkholderia heleia]|uniref:PoNe immunity protein domain-containing protein n=1 Tax=Paraburkholderia heleia TaxID=634127 RepID=UPI0031D015F3
MADFSQKRRQRFISEPYFKWLSGFLVQSIDKWSNTLPANGTEAQKRANAASSRADGRFELLLLSYTAGEPIAAMRDELDAVVVEYEQVAKYQGQEFGRPDWPAFLLNELADYERAMQLIGLCHLLHRKDLLPRIAALEDPMYRAQDTLYEDLLAYGIDDRVDVDTWFHESYRDCINSVYGDSDEESLTDLDAYLEKWYASMRGVQWHDSHLDLSEDKGLYFGYWAIEAAALAYLLELDDTSLREHIVYPKDLVDFARSFQESAPSGAPTTGPVTVRTGQICPETGVWKAQGFNVPGVLVKQGDVMPDVFAPDRSGAHRPQPAMWAFERKA